MRIIDLSQPIIHQGPNCPVHPPIEITQVARHPEDGWHMEVLRLASHTGSHIDAPLHKIAGGKSIDQLGLDGFVGSAVIADLRGVRAGQPIDGALLATKLPARLQDMIVLLATGWGDRRAKTDEWTLHSPFLSPDGAEWLHKAGIRAVGIDHYSIGGSREPGNARTHEILLGNGIWVVEELRFPEEAFTTPQPALFSALPVNLPGFSGSFCRPVILCPNA